MFNVFISNGHTTTEAAAFANYGEAEAAGFPVSSSEVFISVGTTEIFQGWKLHVSAKPTSLEKILEIVKPVLQKYDPHFKYTSSFGLKHLLAQPTQRGKFITIYPDSLIHANEIAEAIDSILQAAILEEKIDPFTDFETIVSDAQLGNTGGLFTRYGEYKKGLCTITKAHCFLKSLDALDCSENHIIKDARIAPLPEFAHDWLTDASPFPNLKMEWSNLILWE